MTFMKIKAILKNRYVLALLAVILTVLLEIFVFNFSAFKVANDVEVFSLPLDSAVLNGFEENGGALTSSTRSPSVEFLNINKRIETIYLNVDVGEGECVKYTVDFTDETNSSYRNRTGLVSGTLAHGQENTKYVNCQFSGNVGKLKIKLSLDADQTITVNDGSISFNNDIPMDFSFLRVLVILLCIFGGYFILRSSAGRATVAHSEASVNAITAAVCVIACVAALFATTNIFTKDIYSTGGDQITKELVDAFASGSLTLDREVEKELLELENPYDWSQRLENGTVYAWDHVMFEGEYYSYYGIAPVVLLFLPFHLITGYYFSTAWAVFLFGAVGLLFLAMFYKSLCRRFFGEISVGAYLATLIMLIVSCGVWYCFITPNFYEIAQTCGFMFVCMGAYFMVSGGIFSSCASKVRICLSSVFFSLAVLSRPTTAVWCIAAVAFIAFHTLDMKKDGKAAKSIISFLSCALVPFAVIGSVQMIYNYARFGSFTDFGIQYSLTINDFTRAEFSIQSALIGFYNFLFAVPVVKPEYPFIFSNFSDLGVNGYYFIANRIAIGQFFRVLPTFAFLLLPSAIKALSKKSRVRFGVLWSLCCIVLPFTVIYSIWESGYGVRYCVDFSWQMTTGAFAILFTLYSAHKNETVRKIFHNALFVCLLLCVAVNVATYIEYGISTLDIDSQIAGIANTLEFWK